ncbi:4Fe-4S binding protein [Desulfurococcaceae archaeon MEX13E-LK6-19]|nr:4Fe-4S binding protein [Desulfurococcaceae archaeon MEX13E-LK6-19]
MTNIAWAVTGGGSYIRELAEGFLRLKKKYSLKITIFASKWGYEVARIYGVLHLLKEISPGGYYEELLVGDKGFYYIGRFNMKRYKLLVLAPATANTVAKIVYGIADTLPTAVFAQATKSDVPVIILPTDLPGPDGYAVSYTPCYVDQSTCMYRIEENCPPVSHCPVNALEIVDGAVRIDLSKCIGCMECTRYCKYNAIKCWEEIKVRPRKLDVENIMKLKSISGVKVVSSPNSLFSEIEKILNEIT